MRKFKNKQGVIYNVNVDSIAKYFEKDSQYTEIKETKNNIRQNKNSKKSENSNKMDDSKNPEETEDSEKNGE
ncbi:MAG TPA: hypothetical protein IAB27_05225 [Candidatus Coprosoma intestinipullorum]|uniref:Uncharacterized protein n=1 Tax=Candidatus Coprosoma intestinipullorum TaxID=2840752 RepID=A0A9D1CZB7_9FIRM|nr:hypothetical protein [Candidatus Coprosoma intestinipullorum]